MISISEEQFEHLLNCMCNQRYILEMSKEVQREWQDVIDKAYHEARMILHAPKPILMDHECPGEHCTSECNNAMAPSEENKALQTFDKQFYAAQANFRI